jgi:hypothetical protein
MLKPASCGYHLKSRCEEAASKRLNLMRIVLAAAAYLVLSACGQAPSAEEGASALKELKGAAVDHAGAAAEAVMSLVDTRTACLAVGQSPITCDCLAGELGNELDQKVVDTLTGVLKATVAGDAGAASEAAKAADPQTTQALVRCGLLGAVAGG